MLIEGFDIRLIQFLTQYAFYSFPGKFSEKELRMFFVFESTVKSIKIFLENFFLIKRSCHSYRNLIENSELYFKLEDYKYLSSIVCRNIPLRINDKQHMLNIVLPLLVKFVYGFILRIKIFIYIIVLYNIMMMMVFTSVSRMNSVYNMNIHSPPGLQKIFLSSNCFTDSYIIQKCQLCRKKHV
ncbi:hypothetical protein QTP88_015090 [Uroleucon formosanum]